MIFNGACLCLGSQPMELTTSWERVFEAQVRRRYEFAEVRNAAATLQGTSPAAFQNVVDVLKEFKLPLLSLTDPQGAKSEIARMLDEAFRKLGWREGGHLSETKVTFTLSPYKPAGETKAVVREVSYKSEG